MANDPCILPVLTIILPIQAMVALRESRLVPQTSHLVQVDGLAGVPSNKPSPASGHQSSQETYKKELHTCEKFDTMPINVPAGGWRAVVVRWLRTGPPNR